MKLLHWTRRPCHAVCDKWKKSPIPKLNIPCPLIASWSWYGPGSRFVWLDSATLRCSELVKTLQHVTGKLVSSTLYRPFSITRRVFPLHLFASYRLYSAEVKTYVPVAVWTINISPMFVATGWVVFLLRGSLRSSVLLETQNTCGEERRVQRTTFRRDRWRCAAWRTLFAVSCLATTTYGTAALDIRGVC